uniref:Uncharacterized protein n=1 Tax=Rhizophora mucronata TaxID=61149 RepID=A0A2P2QP31_RHIMU
MVYLDLHYILSLVHFIHDFIGLR